VHGLLKRAANTYRYYLTRAGRMAIAAFERLTTLQRVFCPADAARCWWPVRPMLPRVRWAKDPVGLNRPYGGGAMGIELLTRRRSAGVTRQFGV
jgi:hypothetical protein